MNNQFHPILLDALPDPTIIFGGVAMIAAGITGIVLLLVYLSKRGKK